MNNDTYNKWNRREPACQITWREVLDTLAIIAVILFVVGLIDAL